jgi:lipoyl(octanoyl) transferase
MPGRAPILAIMSEVEWRVSQGPEPYPAAVAEMEARVADIRAGTASELVWLLEHPPLYTAGTGARDEDLVDPHLLPVYRAGRGGKFTYHGPGQRVAYVMLDLARRKSDPRAYVRDLEEWIIRALGRFGLCGERREGRVGIWISHANGSEAKIAAIGVRIRRWVSFHGISINLNPDLSHYRGIVPCGIHAHGVTSLATEGIDANMPALDEAMRLSFAETFGRSAEKTPHLASAHHKP